MEPIAKYRERRFERSCDFELFPTELLLRGRVLGSGRFESRRDLSTLKISTSRTFFRSGVFTLGVVITGFSLFVWFMLRSQLRTMPWNEWPNWGVKVTGLLGIILIAKTFKSIEYVHYSNHADVISFSVGRVGPDKARFDEFLALLNKTIQAAQKSN